VPIAWWGSLIVSRSVVAAEVEEVNGFAEALKFKVVGR
jgi:hypothetical protein